MRRLLISTWLLTGCGPSYTALQEQLAAGASAFAVVDGSCDGYEDDDGCKRFIQQACAGGFAAQRADAAGALAAGRGPAAIDALSPRPHRACAPGSEANADAIEEVRALQAVPADDRPRYLATLGARARAGQLPHPELFTPLLDASRDQICGVHRASVTARRPGAFAHGVDPSPWLAALGSAAHWCPPGAQVEITRSEGEALAAGAKTARSLFWRSVACVRAKQAMPGLAATCTALGGRLAGRLPAFANTARSAPAARIPVGAALTRHGVASLDPALAAFADEAAQAEAELARGERTSLVVETEGPRATEPIRAQIAARVRAAAKTLTGLGMTLDAGGHPATLRVVVPSAPRVRETKRVEYGTSRYLSGTRWVNNPDFYHRNAACTREQGEFDDCLRRYEDGLRRLDECRKDVARKERERAVCQRKGGGYCPSVYDNCVEPRQCDRRDAAQACELLARTPPQVEEEVWADHRYPIEVVTVTGSGAADVDVRLLRGTESGARETVRIRVEASDRFVAGDPDRNVPHDPLDLPDDDALNQRFARRAASAALNRLAAVHAQNCRERIVASDPLDRLAQRARRQAWGCPPADGAAIDLDRVLDAL